ncbi:hypothetical protein [Metabacillus indicus]|uniref:Lipoprotein n=1 Tax=Metabacillus indicus TaxID=246786 RepID=A0A084GW61_METID|nr:hypothetical protein [Metabacillus indicus]KEZ51573.1 hypothetical protein GS18_0210580 [Metabacillus indicus]
MRNVTKITTVLMILLLTACSPNTTVFTGESDNWKAELKIIHNDNNIVDQYVNLQFKGNDLDSAGNISYEVDTNAGGFGGSGLELNEKGHLKGSDLNNKNVLKTTSAIIFVEWNGEKEEIFLRK